MTKREQRTDVLICIPCFNSQGEIEQVIKPLLRYSDADLLLVDDHSKVPLRDIVQQRFPCEMERIKILRPKEKVYSGGAKNIGINKSLDEGYRFVILLDSDVVTPREFIPCVRQFFRENPSDVVVAPAILPDGKGCQYADTLINFSSYLPERTSEVSRKNCLAGYAFALNLEVFRQRPCFHLARFGGDDVLFVRQLMKNFELADLPVLNRLPVLHQPPRGSLRKAFAAQQRYGRAFFTHNDGNREYLFNKLPLLHLLTPRFYLMLARLIRRRRFRDLTYLPLCWCLDFARSMQIVRLTFTGYRDPGLTS